MSTPEPAPSGGRPAELRHILRTPINHMIGYAELLLEDEQRPRQSEPYLATILACAQQILTLVQRHLQSSDPSSAASEVEILRAQSRGALREAVEATEALSRIETGQRLEDVERIRFAAEELLAFAVGSLPPNVQTPRRAVPVVPQSPAKIVARFLIVDDSELGREMLCRMLERQGHTCVAVESAAEAVACLRSERFDMVLLDFMMPGTTGMELLNQIKSEPGFQETAIVMLSAFDEVAEIGRCLELGAEDYLLKPFDRAVLTARLHAILERKRLQNLERKRTEQLEAAECDLRRSNEDLQRFASVVSHDLQEPLRMISNYVQLLQLSLGESASKEQRDYIHFAIDGAKRMTVLIQELLAYSNVTGRDHTLEAVDCNEVLDEIKLELGASIAETGAVIVHPPLPQVTANRPQMRQLFQNLISNAIKYRSQAPPVIRIAAQRVDRFWQFSVSDNGIGIEPEYQDTIFGMFVRLHSRSVGGAGIGLAICQRVIERLGGRIWLESAKGKGSTFFFTIPA
ncbi:MAG TPA: response regulator [Bryobacteraceae bacterium]|nr:response regulator [Bryobacteraceae bacterium]